MYLGRNTILRSKIVLTRWKVEGGRFHTPVLRNKKNSLQQGGSMPDDKVELFFLFPSTGVWNLTVLFSFFFPFCVKFKIDIGQRCQKQLVMRQQLKMMIGEEIWEREWRE